MNNAEFDNYAKNYHQQIEHRLRKLIDPSENYFIEIKAKILNAFLEDSAISQDNEPLKILDLGCGLGEFRRYLQRKGRSIYGLDSSFEMIRYANRDNAAEKGFYCQADGFQMPVPTGTFDVVFTSCVFHHMGYENLDRIIPEIKRVCKSKGRIIIFEHNPNNLFTQLVVRTTPIDRNAKLIRRSSLIGKMEQHELTILDKGYFIFGPKLMDEFLFDNFPNIRRSPLGGQYYIHAINS
jgi:SAM-dependent methyltransferase